VITPGQVATAAHEQAQNYDLSPFKESDYYPSIVRFKEMMKKLPGRVYSPEDVAGVILNALTVTHPKVRYTVLARPMRDWILPKIFPKRWAAKAIARQIGLLK